MIIPFSYLEQRRSAVIGIPSDGILVINSGQTVTIAEGSVKRYSDVIIRSGGVLQISGNTGSWTEIGIVGNLICDGIIECRIGYDGQSTPTSGTFSKTSVFGLGTLTHTITQAAGGAGSRGGGSYGALGGAQNAGRGGGGGGASTGSAYPGGVGGAGGSNGSGVSFTSSKTGTTTISSGGAGGGLINGSSASSKNGASGSGGGGGGGQGDVALFKGTATGVNHAGGGGGGYRGHHGKGLVLYVEGTVGGAGLISCAGRNGFAGGNGTGADVITYSSGGGGGGGGAGGCGGKLIVKYGDLGRDIVFSAAGGAGGIGGLGGLTYAQLTDPVREPSGSNGSAGAAGTVTLSKVN